MEQNEWAWPCREAGSRNNEEMGVAEAERNPLSSLSSFTEPSCH